MRRARAGYWVALGIALLVTVYAYWDFFESRRLRLRMDAIVASGAPIRLGADRLLSGDAADADRFYRAAAILVDRPSPASASAELRVRDALRSGDWTPEITTLIRGRLNEQSEALSLVDRAAPLPFEGFEANWRPNYGIGGLIALARLCEMRAVERTLAGDGDAAFDSLYADVRLERVTGRVPAFNGLAFVTERARPSTQARARLAEALRAIDRDDRLQQSLIRLRAQLFDMRPPPYDALPWMARPWMSHALVNRLDLFADLIAAAGRPAAERFEAVLAVGKWPTLPPFGLSPERARATLEGFAKNELAEEERIRCARRLVAGEMVNCLR